MEKEYNTLFQIDSKGITREWNIHVRDSTITRTYGIQNKKCTTIDLTIEKGKNINKTNETTPHQQAIKHANSLFKKQLCSGYSEKENDVFLNIRPMLAHTYYDSCGIPDKNKVKHITIPFYMQPKLDGVRMIVGKQLNGKLSVMSRTGKQMHNMEHVTDELFPLLKPGEYVDGENFTFNMSFEDITGICRTSVQKNKVQEKNRLIHFNVFDYFNVKDMNMTFQERYRVLQNRMHGLVYSKLVPVTILKNISEIDDITSEYTNEGYEGGMIRNRDSLYKMDTRSIDLIKVKSFITNEFVIEGFAEADGRDKGTVIWLCSSVNGSFKVRPRGTMSARKKWFEDGASFIGKELTVRYQQLTEHGIPRFPSGIAIRDYE
jgi:ATP-dependent DNA ligase